MTPIYTVKRIVLLCSLKNIHYFNNIKEPFNVILDYQGFSVIEFSKEPNKKKM